jgi:hypothetical protein
VLADSPNGDMILVSAPDCLPANQYPALESALLIADPSTGLVMALDRTGTIDTLYQSQDARGVVTESMVEGSRNLVANARSLSGSAAIEEDAFLASVGKVGDPLPSVWSDALWSGRLLWLRRAGPCLFGGETVESSLWDVITPDNRARVAVVAMPAGLQPLAVSSDRVLCVTRDETNIEYVGVYRIIR